MQGSILLLIQQKVVLSFSICLDRSCLIKKRYCKRSDKKVLLDSVPVTARSSMSKQQLHVCVMVSWIVLLSKILVLFAPSRHGTI